MAAAVPLDAFSSPGMRRTDDPAFQAPRELKPVDPGIISREIPIVSTQTGYAPSDVRRAIEALTIGLFDLPSQMTDTVLADSRVQATMASRTGGLLGRPVTHTIPKGFEDDDDAKKAL